jgi:tetratricopeptide (TPR) repeat protein
MLASINLNDRKQKNKIILLIFVLVFLLYGNSIKNNYSLDDDYVTVTNKERPNNPRIEKGIRGIPKIFSTHYIESKQQTFEYRPLVLVSFAIEYQFFGSNPHISHFINVLIYAFTIIVLFFILLKILKEYNSIFILLITLLFLIHPIHTEVVANIKSRDELLSFFFGLSSLLYAIKYVEQKKIKYIIPSMIFLLMALLCKKTAIFFIGLIPITYYYFYSVKPKQIIIFFSILIFSLVFLSVFKKAMLSSNSMLRVFAFFENPLYYEENLAKRIPLALYSMGYYLKLLIFPYPLCCYYGYNTIPFAQWTTPFVIITLFFYLTIIIYTISQIKQKSIMSYGIIIFLIGLLPFSNLLTPSPGIVAERFVYFGSLGFCISIAYCLLLLFKVNIKYQSEKQLKKLNPLLSITLLLIFVFHTTLTISRNSNWKDEITLFRNDTKKFKNSCNLHYITGNRLYREIFNTKPGQKKDSLVNEINYHFRQALVLMEKGVKEYPKDYTTLNNIGTIYVNIFNDAKSAQPYFKKSLLLKPTDEVTQYNYAFCFEKKNLEDSAIIFYEKMITNQTNYLPVYSQLRALYLKKMDFDKTIECDKKAVNISQQDARLYINLGNSYISNKDTLNGIIQFEKAIELEPTNFPLKKQIIAFLDSAGFTERAKKIKNTSLTNDAP